MTNRNFSLYFMTAVFVTLIVCAILVGFAIQPYSNGLSLYFYGLFWGMVLAYTFDVLYDIWKKYLNKENKPIIPAPRNK